MSIPSFGARVRLIVLVTLALAGAVCVSASYAGKPPPSAPPVLFTVTVVPELSRIYGLNDAGDMVGEGSLRPRVYIHATRETTDLTEQICDVVGGGASGVGLLGINDSDGNTRQVCGAITDGTGSRLFRCAIDNDAQLVADSIEVRDPPPGFSGGCGFAINNFGDVVGELYVANSYEHRAFLWTAGGELDVFLDTYSQARGINDAGQVTGFMNPAPNQHAFLYTPGSPVQDLNTLPRRNRSFGEAINLYGDVAGYSYGPASQVAFRYTATTGTVALGTLSGDTWSAAHGINDKGQVVGVSSGKTGDRGFLYTDANKMLDLGPLIVNSPELDVRNLQPEAINDYDPDPTDTTYKFGQIAARATVNGVLCVVLLTPDR